MTARRVLSIAFLASCSFSTFVCRAAQPQQSSSQAERPEIPLEPIPDSHCPNPDASGKYHVGCGVTAPRVIFRVNPQLPQENLPKIKGTATVNLTVDVHGAPENVRILHSVAESLDKKYRKAALKLDQAALAAVSQYRFTPAMKANAPVEVPVNIEINFEIF
jgi:TonB family protein